MCLPAAAIPFIIAGAGAAAGGVAQGIGSANAGAAMKDAQGKAMDASERMYAQQREDALGMWNQQRQDIAPWMQAGQSSLGELMRQMQAGAFDQQFDPSQLANDPGYQFRMEQGQKALERSASARGLMNSGGALKSLARYSQGVAADEFQNAWGRNQSENTGRYNRLANMAGLGQQAAQNLGNWGGQHAGHMGQMSGQHASNMGGLFAAGGNIDASNAMAQANMVSNGFNTLGGLVGYGMSQIPTQSAPPAYGQSTLGYQTQGFGPWR